MRATVMCARKRRRSGSQAIAREVSLLTASCRLASPPPRSWTSTASARGRRGGSHSGAPTDTSSTYPAQALTAAPIVSISSTGRLPRKQSVRCWASGSSTRSGAEAAGGSLKPSADATSRAQAASSSRTAGGTSTATNRRAVARWVIVAGAGAQPWVDPRRRGRRSGVGAEGKRSLLCERAADHVHRHGCRAVAHVGPPAREVDRAGHVRGLAGGDAQPDQAHRLVLGAAAGAGHAGHAHAHIGTQPRAGTVG